ncbi:conjugal transfer protein, partial [Streptococcus agalactiae]|nr:conjugal transfer protein [Streptococcus agalactiae]
MIIKKIYEGIANLPRTNENWKLGIVLMKDKQFYYDTFARKLATDSDVNSFNYQHAYFSLSGNILEIDREMSSQLVLI